MRERDLGQMRQYEVIMRDIGEMADPLPSDAARESLALWVE